MTDRALWEHYFGDSPCCGDFWHWWGRQLWEAGAYWDVEHDPHAQCRNDGSVIGPVTYDPDDRDRCAPKQFVKATFWVTMQVGPYPDCEGKYLRDDHAKVVLEELWEKWQPSLGKSFVVTHGSADGDLVKIVCTYAARGANADDARRRVVGAAKRVGRFVVGKPKIERR